MTRRQERFTAGAIGFLAGFMLLVALLASGWQANAPVQEYYDGENHWLCFQEEPL